MDETFFETFPEMAEQIFEQLNNEDLIKSKEVNQAWCDLIITQLNLIDKRLFWKRMIQSCTRKVKNYKSEYNLVLKKIPTEILKKFALTCLNLFMSSSRTLFWDDVTKFWDENLL